MLTPIEIQNMTFKSSATGYSKSQVDSFRAQIQKDYETLYRQNMELTDKISILNDRVQYYSSMEKSLHKALVLAEKSAEETKRTAEKNAASIEKEARAQAQIILSDASNDLYRLHEQTLRLMQQYETYKAQFLALVNSQKDLLASQPFQINVKEFEAYTEYLQNVNKNETNT